jgi:hypothetical protein
VVLIGVQDDGAIAARALDAGTQDDIHRAMQAARDVGRYGLSQLDVDGKPVTVLSIARRREGFAQTSAGVVRVRRGTRDDPLFGAELVRFDLGADPRTVLLGEGVVDTAATTWLVAPAPPPGGEHPFVQPLAGVAERCLPALPFTGAEAVE